MPARARTTILLLMHYNSRIADGSIRPDVVGDRRQMPGTIVGPLARGWRIQVHDVSLTAEQRMIMHDFDCNLIPVSKAKLEAYRRFSVEKSPVHREYGEVRVVDCILDPDTADGSQFHAEGAQAGLQGAAVRDFPTAAAVREGEVVVPSWTEWPTKQVRDEALPRVLADPRVQPEDGQEAIFGGTRLIAGGFLNLVDV